MDDGYQRHRDGVEGLTKTDTMVWLMCSSGGATPRLTGLLDVLSTLNNQVGFVCVGNFVRCWVGR